MMFNRSRPIDLCFAAVLALASAEEVEREALAQYEQMKRSAASQRALASADNAQLQWLRRLAAQLIPQASRFNERAKQWQ